MITNNKMGSSSLAVIFFGPLFFSIFLFVVAFFYYFSFQLASQYFSYQALLCRLSFSESQCISDFRDDLKIFKGIKIIEAKITKVKTSKSFKLKIHWQDRVLNKQFLRRENSVYIPKRI